jgi:hypothetical protein
VHYLLAKAVNKVRDNKINPLFPKNENKINPSFPKNESMV